MLFHYFVDYLELLPPEAKSLKQSLKAIYYHDGKKEEIDLSYSKLSQIVQNRPDIIFSHELLDGEALLLKNVSDFLVIKDSFYTFFLKNRVDLKVKGRSLQIGSPLVSATVTVSNPQAIFYINEIVDAVYPLPFRDSSFDTVIISEVLDYDIIREAARVIKKGGKAYLIINAFKGVKPVEAIRAFSIKFIPLFVKELNGFWIFEGIKKD